MPTIPAHWYHSPETNKPKQFDFQMSITNFIRPTTSDSVNVPQQADEAGALPGADDCDAVETSYSVADYMS